MKAPCKTCPDKGCGNHANCERYQEYRQKCDEIRLKKANERLLDGYQVGEVVKEIKSSRRGVLKCER